MKGIIASLLLLLCCQLSFAGIISGTITDNSGKPLPYASIIIKGTSRGVVANSVGKYSIQLENGSYTVVCQYVGFTAQEKTVRISGNDIELNFELKVQELSMEEVVIKRGEDPAIEIMKQAIKKREYYNSQVDSFIVDVYIKGLMRSRKLPEKFMGRKIEREDSDSAIFDSAGRGILYLAETVTRVNYKKPDKYKFEVLSSRVSGGMVGGIDFPIFINFYTNNITLISSGFNQRGFVSPVADNAFHYYRFKYEGNFFEGDKMINQIRVTPRRKHEPLFSGTIFIVDGDWRIHSLDLITTKDYQLDLLDTLAVKQIHAPVSNDVWRTQNQVVFLAAKIMGLEFVGNFLNVYNDYNLNPEFDKKFFNRVIMTYDTAYNKRDSSYWSHRRPVPLEPEEKKDFIVKDSIFQFYRDSMYSQRNIDSLRKRRKRISASDIFLFGISRNFYNTRNFSTYRIEPMITSLSYNTVEGVSFDFQHSLTLRPKEWKSNLVLAANLRYGFSNKHLNPSAAIIIKPKDFFERDKLFSVSGGKRVKQLNPLNPVESLTNAISTLFFQNNYLKIYENYFGEINYKDKFENGIRINAVLMFEDRIPLENSTNFSFKSRNTKFSPNHPYEMEHIPFEKHKAVITNLGFSFQPGQRYIQYPNRKVSIGSTAPVFAINYSKGIKGLLGSVADFDKWNFSVTGNMNLKLKGQLEFKLGAGGFLNSRRVDIPDYTHFIGNQIKFASVYLGAFQLAPYYRYSNTEKIYGLMHLEHHFNGLLTNKIPLFNKLKWNLLAGTNTFYVNRDNYYAEVFVGIENIIKFIRIDFITAYQAESGNPFGIKFGFGGALGGMLNAQRR